MVACCTAADRIEAGLLALRSPLNPDSPLWAWATEAIGERAETMLEHLEGVKVGEDIEAVHDMRVWSRRLVAAMRVFADCFPDRAYRRLLREARRVTRGLGGVRDLDVLIDHYQRLRETVSKPERIGIDYFLALRARERERARRPMLEALDELGRSAFPKRLRKYLCAEAETYAVGLGPSANGCLNCEQSFRSAAPTLLTERYRTFYGFEQYVRQPEKVEELHEMRIAAKWLRYTMELFSPTYADGLKGPLGAVKKFQELLGDIHDSDVRRWLLAQMLDEPLSARGLEAVGLLVPDRVVEGLRLLSEREEGVRRKLYRAFVKEWERLEGKGFAASCLRQIEDPDG